MTIQFYDQKDAYYEFSNFYGWKKNHKMKLVINNKTWPTTEHYFQAQKFNVPDSPRHQEYIELISKADTPTKAFYLGCQKQLSGYQVNFKLNKDDVLTLKSIIDEYKDLKIRPDWDTIKVDVMKTALLAKFSTNDNLKQLLLDTDNEDIVENSPRDSFWGIGKDGKGVNMLGKLLMDVRDMIKM